ncbi:MAG: hypothetical protein QNJ22_06050 [Desulfosarcinaceae bacterium]|nr:hypothetical protein [Desulfosarcinaceae bacterium]
MQNGRETIKRTERMGGSIGWAAWVVALALFGLCAGPAPLWAGDGDWSDEGEIPFDVAEIYFELNDTDGDLGIHSLIDGEPWRRLEIEDPRERKMLNIFVQGRLRRQGLTELFFESAEPTFDELNPNRFFRRFREGYYEIEGVTLDGQELESVAELTHLLPAPPENVTINGVAVADDCDAEPLPAVIPPVTVAWEPVTLSHPELGITNAPIEVVRYQVVVEFETEEGFEGNISMDLPAEVEEVVIPEVITDQADEFKLEILVREESGNQTAMETCFTID